MKKALLTSCLFITLCFNVNAQCSIKRYNEGTASMNEAKFEYLYKYVGENNSGDYTQGYITAYGRVYTMVKQSVTSWRLQIIVTGSDKSGTFVPREAKFYFKDGTSLKLTASTYSEEESGQLCTFPLSASDVSSLRSAISLIRIMDRRTNLQAKSDESTGLYDKVLAEQISCLL